MDRWRQSRATSARGIRPGPREAAQEDAWTFASSKRCSRWPRTGSFTAAADRLHTVQSNVSEHVRQLEAELGVQLLVRGRRGTVPTEFGVRVIERARAIRSEIEALRKDLSMLQGLETGHATLGVVGTVSRLLVPDGRRRDAARARPALSLRLTEGASERLAGEVAERQLASAVVTEPVSDPRLARRAPPRRRPRRARARRRCARGGREPIALARARRRDADPPARRATRCATRSRPRRAPSASSCACRSRSKASGSSPTSSARAWACRSCPRPRSPDDHAGVRQLRIARMPPRRLALVTARGVQLSLADQAVHDVVRRLVRDERLPHAATASAGARSVRR